MPYLVDTNILLHICDRSSSEHEIARAAVSELIQKGKRATQAHHLLSIVTFNVADFARYSRISVRAPQQVLASAEW